MSGFDAASLNDRTRDACGRRLERLRAALEHEGLDGLLVTTPTDIRYLTGFVGDDSLLLVGGDAAVIVSDARYDEFLDPWRQGDQTAVVMGIRHRLEQAVERERRQRSVRRLGFAAEHVTVAQHGKLASALSGAAELKPTTGVVAKLRMRKDALEVERIEQGIAWQQAALKATLEQLRLGMSELQLAALLEYEMRTRGAFGASFGIIVGSGANSSIIHYMPGGKPIEAGTLLIDWGAASPDGYNSDLTRTFGVGHMPEAVEAIYKIVLEAQLAAIDACRPGRVCAEIDAVARKVITDAGHGKHFGHGLGHGLGMEVHESPYFNDLQTDVVLEPGMVMTVEPGIYLPGVGGVRIEDDVLITDGGCRVLSDWPKDPAAVIVEPQVVGV